MSSVFITGTDTGVGKSLFSAWLCLHWGASYWKPIQSGLEGETDTEFVHRLSECPIQPEAFRLTAPLSPDQSAAIDGIDIHIEALVKPLPPGQHWVIEGAGGCLVPINQTERMSDLMLALQAPVLVVARSGLGTINHSCLTLEHLQSKGVPVLGVALMGPTNGPNRRAIEHFSGVPVVAELPFLPEIHRQALLDIPMPNPLKDALATLKPIGASTRSAHSPGGLQA